MFERLRSGVLAGGGALLLVLALSSMALGASLTSDTGPTADTTFVDVDGDGVADYCQTETAVENTDAAAAAFEAADLDGDGAISVSEAAQTDWTGGLNCNHGGYVSEVAQAAEDACDTEETTEPEATEEEAGTEETGTEETGTEEEAAPEETTAECEAEDAEEEAEEAEATDETCEAVAAPELDPATDTSTWNHGDWVTWVAKSDATGGKNCNHGGAVSEASKAANEAAKAERAAQREAAKAERDAKKAERQAARELKKQERQAGKANKGHGKPN
jgi:EF hand domain-containing protein